MQPTTRSINVRLLVIYGLVAVGLLALVIGGIVWAKSRSTMYAAKTQPTTQAVDANNSGQQEPSPSQQQPATDAQPGVVAGAQPHIAASTGPSVVPATGAGDWLSTSLAVIAVAFAITYYVQSRRRLQDSR